MYDFACLVIPPCYKLWTVLTFTNFSLGKRFCCQSQKQAQTLTTHTRRSVLHSAMFDQNQRIFVLLCNYLPFLLFDTQNPDTIRLMNYIKLFTIALV